MQGSRNPQGSHRNGPGHCGVHIRASEKGPLQRTPRSEAMCLIPYSKLSSWASTLGPASVLHGAAASEPAGDRHGGLRPTEATAGNPISILQRKKQVQRGQETCSRSHSEKETEVEFTYSLPPGPSGRCGWTLPLAPQV
ncbi:uncharacterized protein LOC143659169 isoform X2 [Tamandua tetradactyla]|uniref:uncharacterized protein LOC143659169 isoform X2 n=1 Tax=Tamandua tetradactyla TaxID=48850 RepID=UPI0040544DA7